LGVVADMVWTIAEDRGPVVATAIHDGHEVRDEVRRLLAISEADRLREEDPFTGRWTSVAPTRVIGTRSRFEVDLNRPRESAVYRSPEDAWGLEVWKSPPPEDLLARSLANYDAFYAELDRLYGSLVQQHGRFLVLDLHTYNHRRDGPDGPVADPAGNPQVNVGTGTMPDRARWARLIDRFMEQLAAYDFPGGRLDVRENVRFRGGACARWAHQKFPDSACVLSLEVKKFFMDEWTGIPDETLVDAVGSALAAVVPGALDELNRA
jgi:N-formylglutamate amidohydrolase